MFVKGVKRKCSVRGCKNTDCFAISRTREVGNTVIICKSCLGKALGAIDDIDPKTKSNIPAVDITKAPSLFFNAKALGKTETKDGLTANIAFVDETPVTEADVAEEVQDETEGGIDEEVETGEPEEQAEPEEPEEQVEPDSGSAVPPAELGDTAPAEDAQPCVCPNCGRSFGSKSGLNTHLRYCKPQTESK